MQSNTLNTVTAGGLQRAIADAIKLGTPLMIFGTFGIGKTDIVAGELRYAGFAPITWFRGSHATPDTIAGVPYLDNGALKRAMPELIAACYRVEAAGLRPGLFLDEINLSSQNTLAALLQLLLEKRLGEYELPPDTPIIAAGNMETDGSIVSMMPLPALNRMAVVHYTGPTFSEWEKWAVANDMHPAIVGFLRSNPDWLVARNMLDNPAASAVAPDRDSDRWPTPRSWAMASRHLHLLERNGRDSERLGVLSRYVGDAAALQVEAYFAKADELLLPDEILLDPKRAPLPDKDDFTAAYMNIMTLMQRVLKAVREGQKPVETMEKALMWVSRMNSSMVMLALHMIDADEAALDAVGEVMLRGNVELPEEAFELWGRIA